jgi:hypothetical protein
MTFYKKLMYLLFRIFFVYSIFYLLNNNLKAQDYDRVWCFGDSAGINFSNITLPVPDSSFMDCAQSCASIGDSLNGLLMYAHTQYWPLWTLGSSRTTTIHNSAHEVMINGDSLIGGTFHNGLTFIPIPGSDSIFYLFQWGFSPERGLYYSMIDPFFNNNIGRVIKKNIKLPLTDSLLIDGVYAVKHGNGMDWWILTRNWFQTNRFNLFLVKNDTILGPYENYIGSLTNTDVSYLAFAKDGSKIAMVTQIGLVEVYDFDRCSGIISNAKRIMSPPGKKFFGCEFSENNNVLYVSNCDNIGSDSLILYQFDLTNSNPGATKQIIYSEPVLANGGILRRGPDDKIYFSCLSDCGWRYPDNCRNIYNENLSVINNPNVIGLGCNFTPFSFYLGGKRTYWNLPNNPNYTLGPLSGSICDTVYTYTREIKDNNNLNIFPNPSSGIFYLKNFEKNITIEIFDYSYRLISRINLINENFTIDLTSLNPGIYFIKSNNYLFSKNNYLKLAVINFC